MSGVLKQHEILEKVNAGEILDFVWNHAVEGMAFVSEQGNWLAVNPVMSSWLGYSPPELENMTFMDVSEPGDVKADLEAISEVARGIRPAYTMNKRYKPKSGQPFDAKLTVIPWKDTEGKKVLFFYSQSQRIEVVEMRKMDDLRVVWNFVADNKRWVMMVFIAVALAGDGFLNWLSKVFSAITQFGAGVGP